ncbi:four-carbon acid sugar kinase family protein [Nocardiopsis flavescens]|uniref:Uncharacterized conserved protein YgbK, DUF1537 family n=1 Tax=Nocardiopsis flavescens TaxID=758803 RepID=A0A1M6H3D9_9ACTN|nr:four-carbon acid sugar kinase family protein [Nocardiopsis flavescens]SHJ16672.1 Uncharacterized conserved protein YgbK, DUF1537 family [Nocardiopsis flavescens]
MSSTDTAGHRPAVAVLADDLTGAGDTAVQFLRAGWSTELQLEEADSAAQVVAVTTDTRPLPAAEAARAVGAATRRLRAAGVGHLYKKVDSTLRGPIRAEIDAVLAEWAPGAVAVVCPAFPAAGRTVRDGVLYVEGVPVHETAVGRDPVTPVTESRIPVLLDAAHVRLDGADPARDAEALSAAGPVVVADAATDADLERLAAAVAALGDRAVPVGSAGLAVALARAWAATAAAAPALVVVTSLHRSARGQVETLLADPDTAVEQPSAADLADDGAWRAWSEAFLDRFDPAVPHTALIAPDDRGAGLDPATVASMFAATSAEAAARHTLSGFVVTGGDGARALTRLLGARAVALTGEVAPGIPLGTLSGGPWEGLAIVTKAGGFGTPTALLDAAEAVRTMKGRTV